MSTTSSPDPEAGMPLTRRQRRALERAQQAQREAAIGDLPAPAQPAVQARPVGTASPSDRSATGTPAPRTVSQPQPQPQSRPQLQPHVPGSSHDPRSEYIPAARADRPDRRDLPHGTGRRQDEVVAEAREPEPTPRPRTLGGPLGRMPRGPLAVGLIGVVVLAMILVPLAVNKLVSGRNGTGASTAAQSTVLDGNAPLSQLLTVSGRVGSGVAPSVELNGDASLSAPGSVLTDVVQTGQGRAVSAGTPVILQVSQFSGLNGRNTTGNEAGYKLWQGLLGPEVGEYINAAVSGQREGARVVLREPAEEEDGSRTTKITVVDLLPTTATGEAKQPAEGTPTVTEGPDGSITVSSAGLPAPTRASTEILIKGTGPQIGSQDRLIARTTMVSWTSGQPLDKSTFGNQEQPKQLDMSNALVGVSQNLVDITVGSRVVLSLPAEQAQGKEPVVVVIDVLAKDPAQPSGASGGRAGSESSAIPGSSAGPTSKEHS